MKKILRMTAAVVSLTPDGAELRVPADFPDAKEAWIRSMDAQAFRAVGCGGMARVDLVLIADGEFVVNELNTMPEFTDISVYSKAMAASGVDGLELIDRLIAHGMARFLVWYKRTGRG